MEHKEELIDKVERYLSGKLSREEVKEDLDQELSDKELDEAIDLYNASKDLIELSGLREDLKSIHEEYIAETEAEVEPEEPAGKRPIWLWATAAMAATVLAVAVFSGLLKNNTPEFDDYFEAYPDIVSMRGDQASVDEAMRLYNMKKYGEALAEFDKIQVDTLNDTILFYQAVSALATAELNVALKNFKTLQNYKDNTFWVQTKWYLALTLWQAGKLEEAKALLETVEEGEKDYEKAQDLYGKLD